jgi:hypothetical protein
MQCRNNVLLTCSQSKLIWNVIESYHTAKESGSCWSWRSQEVVLGVDSAAYSTILLNLKTIT